MTACNKNNLMNDGGTIFDRIKLDSVNILPRRPLMKEVMKVVLHRPFPTPNL